MASCAVSLDFPFTTTTTTENQPHFSPPGSQQTHSAVVRASSYFTVFTSRRKYDTQYTWKTLLHHRPPGSQGKCPGTFLWLFPPFLRPHCKPHPPITALCFGLGTFLLSPVRHRVLVFPFRVLWLLCFTASLMERYVTPPAPSSPHTH